MKKRILSMLLACAMLVMLLPTSAHAAYEDGAECANCDHYHWDDHMCKCGLCSIDCTNTDCWAETHCQDCGECFMDVNNWCEECGRCENCMRNEAHCLDCDRCFVGESKDDLCQDCQRCSYCVDDICYECNRCDECAGDDHCRNCMNHLYGDEACGYCEDCAKEEGIHCESCDECFEGDAERCPVHEEETHCVNCAGFICSECNRCEYKDSIDVCLECGLCEECCAEKSMSYGCSTGEICVESGDWEDHFCDQCSGCFCEKEKCETCGYCKDCCAANAEVAGCDCGDVCVESTDWKAHLEDYHGEEGAAEEHTHKYKTEWNMSQTHHWHQCRFCEEKSGYAEHKLTAAGKCESCGYDTTLPLFFVSQPKDVTRKVSDGDASPGEPNHSYENRAEFSVTAVNLAEEALKYQWYEVYTEKATGKAREKKLMNEDYFVQGATTDKLTVKGPDDGCLYKYEYYCVVTSQDADGKEVSITSRRAQLRTVHNYGELMPIKLAKPYSGDAGYWVEIEYTDADGTHTGRYQMGNRYHNRWCVGYLCEHTQLPENTRHNLSFEKYLGKGYRIWDTAHEKQKYFYLWKCSECGYEELRESLTELTELIHKITIQDTPGAYAENEEDNEVLTSALEGVDICAIAPYLNSTGHVFDHWEVVSGPEGFTNDSITNGDGGASGCGMFKMPSGDITLRGVYHTDKVAVNSVKIKGMDPVEVVGGVITVKEGEEFSVDSILAPENIADKRVQWTIFNSTIGSPELTFTEEYQSTGVNTWSKPLEGPVTLKAHKAGTVQLRALTYESMTSLEEHVKDLVLVKIEPAGTHVHDYEDKTVHATCTKNGYILHTCKVEGCGRKYQSDLAASTGHNDSDGDGLCDNVDKNTGKVCGQKLGGADNVTYVIHVENGRASDATGKTILAAKPGAQVTITAKPAPSGQKFAGWTVAEGGVTLEDATKSTTTFTMTAGAVTVRATYTKADSEHTHSADTDKWLYDDENHWNPCADDTCSGHLNEASHDFAWKTDQEATTTEIGFKHEECSVCGAKRSENTVIDKLPGENTGENTGEDTSETTGEEDDESTDGDTSENNPDTSAIASPKTGDDSRMSLWITLLSVSGAGVVGVCMFNRKRKRSE